MADQFLDQKIGVPVVLPTIQTVTPAVSWNNAAGLTITPLLTFTQVGDLLVINGQVNFAGTGSSGSPLQMVLAGATPVGGQTGSIRATRASNIAYTYLIYSGSSLFQFQDENTGASSNILNGNNFGNSASLVQILQFKDVVIKISDYALTAYQSYGAGQALANRMGLMVNAIQPTNLVSTDLTAQTNITIDPSDVTDAKYWMSNNVVTFVFYLNFVTVTAGANLLSFTLPSSVPRPLKEVVSTCIIYDVGTTAFAAGVLLVSTAGVVSIGRAGANFTGSTNNTFLRGQISWSAV